MKHLILVLIFFIVAVRSEQPPSPGKDEKLKNKQMPSTTLKPDATKRDHSHDNDEDRFRPRPSMPLMPNPFFRPALLDTIATAALVPFSCLGRLPGYYADVSTRCEVYHMCLPGGRQMTYSCGSGTIFNQRNMVCDYRHNYDCNRAVHDYAVNERFRLHHHR